MFWRISAAPTQARLTRGTSKTCCRWQHRCSMAARDDDDRDDDARAKKVHSIYACRRVSRQDFPEKESEPRGLDEFKALLAEARPKPQQRDFSLEDLSDENVIDDGDAFHYRFGHGFNWKQHSRESFMKLKAAKRITDSEAKALRLFGNLTSRGIEVELKSSPVQAVFGLSILCYLVPAALCVIIWIFSPENPSALRIISGASGMGMIIAFGYTTYLSELLPWIVNRR